MTRTYVFNGDADGLCALQQLRLADRSGGARAAVEKETLVTGVKRDIALLGRVTASPGDACTVLDISLDVNRVALMSLLDAGASVRYFDHHFTGEIPRHPNFEPYLDLSPTVCTSLLVDRYLAGRFRSWAIVGAFGDSLMAEGQALAEAAGLAPAATERLRELGVVMNYNAYGETIADLHVAPEELAKEIRPYADPLEFATASPTFRLLSDGYAADMDLARRLNPLCKVGAAVLFMLPDAAWARRASGSLANDLAKANAGNAVAIVSPKTEGGFLVSVRVPSESPTSAQTFCSRFPTGGGRRTAAGINHLPGESLEAFTEAFVEAFEQQFRAS